jgi:hypothetical protein
MLAPLAIAHATLSEPGRRLGKHYLTVWRRMVRMGMADEDAFGSKHRLVGIQPESQLGQMNRAKSELEVTDGHAVNLAGTAPIPN